MTHIPCPASCGCSHFVIVRHDRASAVAVCCCNPSNCPDIPLTMEDVTPLELDWRKLANAITTAFGLTPTVASLAPPATLQVGSWSPQAIPVILTIQSDPQDFRAAVSELAAQLRQPFILSANSNVNTPPARETALPAPPGPSASPSTASKPASLPPPTPQARPTQSCSHFLNISTISSSPPPPTTPATADPRFSFTTRQLV